MEYRTFEIYKGLQRPLALFGLQGRYILWGACTALGAFLGFTIGFTLWGLLMGLFSLAAILLVGMGCIALRQKKGLHAKKAYRGVKVVNSLFQTYS